MTAEELRNIVKEAVKEEMDREIKPFYVDREQHYKDHQFLQGLQEYVDGIASTALKTVVKSVISGLIILLLLGFGLWVRKVW